MIFSMNSLDILNATPVMPVIVIDRLEDAVPLAEALVAGGIRVLEVTLRSPVALEAIRQIVSHVPDAIVGVGSVRTPEDWKAAIEAGAQFGVSPGTSPQLIDAIASSDVPFIPGVATPSEAMALSARGFNVLKLFPATVVGGTAMLKAISGPLPELNFCPTGGISPSNVKDFLALDNVKCVGGTWMLDKSLIEARNWEAIKAAAQEAVTLCN
jgi:2-dehydro-3-deoxyphosphogluconate aldolase/(4S)-4-hydroxy-2-oxoglutarate aldolase